MIFSKVGRIFLYTIFSCLLFAFLENLIISFRESLFSPTLILLAITVYLITGIFISTFLIIVYLLFRPLIDKLTFKSIALFVFSFIYFLLTLMWGMVKLHAEWLPYHITPLSLKGLFFSFIIIIISAGLSILIYLINSAIINSLSKFSFFRTKTLLKCYLFLLMTLFLLYLFQTVVNTRKVSLDADKISKKLLLNDINKESNIILIVIDALRADHLPIYNYPHLTAPNLEKLAKDGLLFEKMFSNAPETNPSIASLFSSTYTSTHGVFTNFGERLPNEALTLQEVLEEKGYYTGAFIANPTLKKNLGFGQGFMEYNYCLSSALPVNKLFLFKLAKKAVILPVYYAQNYYVEANTMTKQIEAWISKQTSKFFLYIHYMDPHMPYFAHPYNGFAFSGDSEKLGKKICSRERVTNLYDSEIKHVDKSIGNLIGHLKQLGLFDDLLLVITADHGEELLDHGRYGHGRTLYEEVIKIPLIIKFPKNKRKGTANNLAAMIDIAPTILDVLNIQTPKQWVGKSLLDMQIPKEEQYVFSEDHNPEYTTSEVKGETFSLRTHLWKLILSTKRDICPSELFYIFEDKSERCNLKDKLTEQRLRELIVKILSAVIKNRFPHKKELLDKETLERLKSLGYIK